MDDILDKIQANYSKISDLSYDVSVSYYIDGDLQEGPVTFHVQQKGGYMLRQAHAGNGLTTVMNASRTVDLDAEGQYEGGFEVDTVANMLSGVISTNGAPYYWDVPGFRSDFHGVTSSTVSPSTNGAVVFQAVPQDTSDISAADLAVDFGHSVPIQEDYHATDGVLERVSHGAPVLIGAEAWLPTDERFTLTFPGGMVIEWRTTISNVSINQGLPDSLFAIPNPQ